LDTMVRLPLEAFFARTRTRQAGDM
jgi:hypothetical protein